MNFNDPSGHYGEDVHLDLTEVLAEAAGFSETDARVIGVMDQGVDEKFPAGLWSDNNALYHFTTEERRDELWNQFEESGSLEDLGTYLHAEQDSFSHAGFQKRHWSTKPDITSNNAAKAHLMALETFFILAKAAKMQGTTINRIEWVKIDKYVWKFINAKTKEEKVKALEKIKEIIREERGKKKKDEPKKIVPHKGKQIDREQMVIDKGTYQ